MENRYSEKKNIPCETTLMMTVILGSLMVHGKVNKKLKRFRLQVSALSVLSFVMVED